MNVRRMLLIAVALVSAEAMAAATWQPIVESADGLVSFYGDPATLTVQGPIRRIRLLYDYKQVQQDPDTLVNMRSQSVLVSLDCVDHRIGPVQEIRYADNMAQGAVVGKSKPTTRVTYKEIAPDSINMKVMQYTCALKGGKRAK
jgi:hypothetical protein